MNYKSVIDLFLDLIKIDSPSNNEYSFLDYISEILKKLRFIIKYDDYDNLIAKLNYKIDKPSILFAFHGDKISTGKKITPIIKDGYITSDGKNSIGADNKASLSSLLWILLNNKIHFTLEIVITRMEEEGFIGARNLDGSILSSKLGIMIDDGIIGDMTISSNYWTKLLFYYNEDISEINQIISDIIDKSIKKIKVKSEYNDKYNVCVDLFSKKSDIDQIIYNIFTSLKIEDYKIIRKCPGYHIDSNEYIYNLVYQSIQKSGIRANIKEDLIGTEACIYNSKEIKMINLGDGILNCHDVTEKIKITDIEKNCEIIRNILEKYDSFV